VIVLAAGHLNPTTVHEFGLCPWLIVVCHYEAWDGAKGGDEMGPFLGRGKRHQDKKRSKGEEAHVEKRGVDGQLQSSGRIGRAI
jgi:hypothetical protein